MPTPSESTDTLPLERQRSTHTTCPPEDDRPAQWRVEVLDRLGRAALDATSASGDFRQPQDSPCDSGTSSASIAIPDQTGNKENVQRPSIEPAEATPPLVGASPSSSHVDEKETVQLYPAASTSSALNLKYSIRYGLGTSRV